MLRRLYTCYDIVAKATFGQVVHDFSDAPVIRQFHDMLGDERAQLYKHAADYELRYLGQMTMEGLILPIEPQVIATGAAWAAAQAPSTPTLQLAQA